MSSDPESGISDSFVSTTHNKAISCDDRIEKIGKQVAKLQGIERGISKKSRLLTDQKEKDSLNVTARTICDSHHTPVDIRKEVGESLYKPKHPDERVQKIQKEVQRLQALQQGLVGGSKNSKMLRTVASMSLTPEQFNKQQKYARTRKYSAIVVGVLLLAGAVGGIVSLVSFMQDENISFRKEKGGNTPQTLQEVALHATTDDCWASIHGNVYDLTEWVNEHPGGSNYIQSVCGMDGTTLYSTISYHPSRWLKVFVEEYRVGPLVAAIGEESTIDIALDELALHNTRQDIWVALHGNVYDLTSWASQHPGGFQHVFDMAGTDGTAMFSSHHMIRDLIYVEAKNLGPLVV
jgi:cytochrome b involved in lipid metabolism